MKPLANIIEIFILFCEASDRSIRDCECKLLSVAFCIAPSLVVSVVFSQEILQLLQKIQ